MVSVFLSVFFLVTAIVITTADSLASFLSDKGMACTARLEEEDRAKYRGGGVPKSIAILWIAYLCIK